MQYRRLASCTLALLVPLAGACDPADEMPPPQTAQAQAGVVPAPEPQQAPQADPQAAAADPSGMYASGEYTIGEDTDAYDDNDPAALTDFRQALDPYGSWVDDPKYGTVWVPSPSAVGPDFVPYQTAGHWVYDDDYVWVSDYEWGWAPFHYGRWVYIDGRGWVWVPGRVYRGAWVAWGVDDGWGYVGWYPMAPAFFWFGGYPVAYTFYVGPRWVYCPRGEVFSPVVGTRVIAGPAAVAIGARVRPYVPATPGVAASPPPNRLGYAAAQIPHASGAAAASLARAQQFARPSTAQPLGAHAPARVAMPGGVQPGGHGAIQGAHGWGTVSPGAHLPPGVQPGVQPGQRRKVQSSGPAPAPRPSFRGGGSRGGFPHAGGGGHGGHR